MFNPYCMKSLVSYLLSCALISARAVLHCFMASCKLARQRSFHVKNILLFRFIFVRSYSIIKGWIKSYTAYSKRPIQCCYIQYLSCWKCAKKIIIFWGRSTTTYFFEERGPVSVFQKLSSLRVDHCLNRKSRKKRNQWMQNDKDDLIHKCYRLSHSIN